MPTPTAHANHVLLAIPNSRLQGLRVGDIATDALKTIIDAWVIPFGPFVVGSGRAKDANAITLEYRDREAGEYMTVEQVASEMGIKPNLVKSLARRGKIPVLRLGHRTLRFRRASVEQAIEAMSQKEIP